MITEEQNNSIEFWQNQIKVHNKLYASAYNARGPKVWLLRAKIETRIIEIENHIKKLKGY